MLYRYARMLRHKPLNIINAQYENSRFEKSGIIPNSINQDIINFNHYAKQHDLYNKKVKLNICGKFGEDKILKTATASDIMEFFCDAVDYINIGEVRTYLNNYLDDITLVVEGMYRHSPTEQIFRDMYSYFDKMEEYIPDGTKVDFCKEYGDKYFEDVYFPDNRKQDKFPMTFKFGGRWTPRSFNKICDFYKKRIDDEFFSNLDKIRSDVKIKYRKDMDKKS